MSTILEKFKFHHIAIITDDIEGTVSAYKLLGYTAFCAVIDKVQNVEIVLLHKENHPMIEVVKPITEKSPGNSILNKFGVSPYHICYEVEEINEAIKELRRNSFIMISNISEAEAFDMRKICFLYHKKAGLIELVEKKLG